MKAEQAIRRDAPRAHFLSLKIEQSIQACLEEHTVLYQHEINRVAEAAAKSAKTILNTIYSDK